MMIKLKPCPFCGKPIRARSEEYIGNTAVGFECECKNCSASFKIHVPLLIANGEVAEIMDDAIAIWNRRVNDENNA